MKSIALANEPTSSAAAIPPPKFRWGTRILLPLAIVIAFAALFASSMFGSFAPSIEVTAVPAIEKPSINQSASMGAASARQFTVQAAGWIEPHPFPVFAAALIDGTVEEVFFLEGDTVKKGDLLARLVNEDARLALQRSEAEFHAAEEVWNANTEMIRREAVAAALVRETSATLELARAELERERALLHQTERSFARRERLIAEGTISHEEHDIALASAKAQAASVVVAERRIQELGEQLDRMRAEHAAAKRDLELRTSERRAVELARVALEEARLQLQRTEIRAPIDGVVMRRYVGPGSRVVVASDNMDAARVAELYDPTQLQVRVDVPLADAAKIGTGQQAEAIIEMLPNRTFSGRVTRVTSRADIQKNTLEVKVQLDAPAAELKPEMLARVRFLAASDSGERAEGHSVFVPANTVANDSAWVVTQYDGTSGIAARRSVKTTGAAQDNWVEIASGIQPGDLLITTRSEEISEGARVRVIRERKN